MSKIFQTISPVDGSIYVERPYAASADIEYALSASAKAQASWSKTSLDQRANICLKAVQYFQDNIDKIADELTWQMGRPIRYSPLEIRNGLKERAEYMIEAAPTSLRDITIDDKKDFRKFIRKEPLGVIFVLAPWNYPYLTSVNAVIPALMAGNSVILKHAAQTPLCAERYAKAFQWAGLPEGVFQYLHLSHQQAAEVVADERIAFVAFTGSVEGGKAIQKAINNRFITAGLELGGKDPAYVCHDADLKSTVENLADGAFFNSGQSCCAIERIYVDEKIFDDFLDNFLKITKQYILGDPTLPETTMGPLVKETAADFARSQIDDALAKGAHALIKKDDFPDMGLGPMYCHPQILIHVDHSMDIMIEESFAPIIGIQRVKTEREAIKLMNDSPYGLTASIWTGDEAKAINIGDQIATGTWFMNRCDYLDPALAWTGVKNSGRGCTLSTLGYDYLTRPKSFHLKLSL